MELTLQQRRSSGTCQWLLKRTLRMLLPQQTRHMPHGERRPGLNVPSYLQRFKEVYDSYVEEMAELLLKETGKPRMFGTSEVQTGSIWLDHHINMTEPKPERYEEESKIIENKYLPLGSSCSHLPLELSCSFSLLPKSFLLFRWAMQSSSSPVLSRRKHKSSSAVPKLTYTVYTCPEAGRDGAASFPTRTGPSPWWR